jgi:MshEN domain
MADPGRAAPTAGASQELGYFLVQRGWLTPDQLRQALDKQRDAGGNLDTCLLEAGAVTEGRLLEGLSQVFGVPAASGEDLRRLRESAYRLLPAKVAERTRAVPFRIVGGELWVAMEDVSDLALQDYVSAVTGRRLRPHVALEARIAEALRTCYGAACSPRLEALLEQLNRPPSLWDVAPGTTATIPLTAAERARLGGREEEVAGEPEAAPEPPPAGEPEAPAAPFDLAEAERRFNRAAELDQIGRILLDYLSQSFRRVLLFKVEAAGVSSWMGRGSGIDGDRPGPFAAGFDRPSVFLNLRQGAGFHLGPLPPMPAHLELARTWRGALPREAMVWPIRVRGRMVVVLYGDRGKAALTGLEVGDLRLLATAAGHSLELYLMRKKHRKV